MLVTIIIALFLVSGWLLGNHYVDKIILSNTESLILRDKVSSEIAGLRYSLWQTDNLLNNFMLTEDKANKDKLIATVKISTGLVSTLINYQNVSNARFKLSVEDLEEDYKNFHHDIKYLLGKSTDPNWVYPMLPFINNVLLDSNNEFETACDLALKETASMPVNKNSSDLYRKLVELRSHWRLKILNFRAVIIRYAGLNSRTIISQESNISMLDKYINDKLAELEQDRAKGRLGIDTDTALDVMKERSARWSKDFKKLVALRESNKWRADIEYVKNNITPKQEHLLDDLKLLEKQISQWSLYNISKLETATHDINNMFGLMSGLALLLIIASYVLLRRSVLTPIKRISEIISSEDSFFKLPSSRFDSLEVSSLIDAFNSMRRQINNRQKALEHQALHDALTGLPNRALLEDRLKYSISLALRNNSNVIVMLFDLNRFKEINDTLGHSVGDAVLKILSERLEACVRESDTVARLGGDEFSIITYGDLSAAKALIGRITSSIQNDMSINGQHLYVSSSIGVAICPEHGSDVETLMQHADIAMYESKKGKSEYVIYSEEFNDHSINNLALLGSLRSEIYKPTDQFTLYYQPQLDLNNNAVIGAEALLRWNHPVFGAIPPEQIIRMAEQTGLISELTDWILDNSFRQCSEWTSLGYNMHVAINLSAWNIQDPNLPQTLGTLVHQHSVDPSLIELEITESTVMSDPIRAREVLSEIDEMGFGIFIDDFGTGFSSLSYLKLLPVNGLKIDKSFVIEMLDDENDKIIVQSTIELAHNLGLKVVAEGVEDSNTLVYLSKLNCDYAQGYFLSVPLTYENLIDWLALR